MYVCMYYVYNNKWDTVMYGMYVCMYVCMNERENVCQPGPIRCPGKSCFNKLRMKDVFPTEYWPKMSTIGLASKSLGPIGGEEKCEYLEATSSGRTFFLYRFLSPSKIKSLSTWVRSSCAITILSDDGGVYCCGESETCRFVEAGKILSEPISYKYE